MNENQHDAYVTVCYARTAHAIKRAEVAKARRELSAALNVLHAAIRRDPDSWSGTPNIKRVEAAIASVPTRRRRGLTGADNELQP